MVPSTSDMTDVDKIDMSLDDIIRLNRQEQHNQALFNGGAQTHFFNQFRGNKGKWSPRWQTGAGNIVQRRPYGGKTALRRMSSWSGVSPLNRPIRMRNSAPQRLPFRRKMNFSRPMDLASRSTTALHRYPFNSNYSYTNTFRSGLRMRQQRDTRQATYFLQRGLKVQTQMDSDQEIEDLNRNRAWRTSMNRSGLLTVSFGNPSAVPSSMGAMLPRPPLPFFLKKEGAEPKVPKGVQLDFDINSVAKQTGITLNERFKILKEQRLSQNVNKGSRFVTVG
ncbi:UAP56-interacting factor isoform X1 [Bufo gargarizans]|uniref:UAP56-interacting factor isoform X1 n=1 Tax=Bufo gargarizans TaxID=30331 RepID=UPI001CF26ADA|nr:UAP56-interacting factor isoform X1 [Bufo gargarizans]